MLSAFCSVLIECQGGYPERFLNLAAAGEIALWDVHRDKESLWCRADAAAYRQLRPIARRAGMRMRIRKKQGIVFRIRRLGLRFGAVAGVALFCLILNVLSSRVWVLRVQGNAAVSDDAILSVLEPLGVYEGASFSDVDLTDLRLTALQQLPDLIWLTVNQHGSIVTVEVQERTPADPIADTAPANLVASCDGVVLQIDTVRGQSAIAVGDAVRRGDLLISGVMDSKVGPQLKHAAGTVLARTTHTLTVTVPCHDTVRAVDREITRSSLSVFGWEIPLYTSGTLPTASESVTERCPVTANGVPLPLGITRTRYTYHKDVPITRTVTEAKALATARLAEQETALFADFAMETRRITTEETSDSVTVTAVYVGTQNIAEERPIAR